jgi:hypothetical protein
VLKSRLRVYVDQALLPVLVVLQLQPALDAVPEAYHNPAAVWWGPCTFPVRALVDQAVTVEPRQALICWSAAMIPTGSSGCPCAIRPDGQTARTDCTEGGRMQHRQRAPGYATLICVARQRVARRAPGGPPTAEPGADAGPAARAAGRLD